MLSNVHIQHMRKKEFKFKFLLTSLEACQLGVRA